MLVHVTEVLVPRWWVSGELGLWVKVSTHLVHERGRSTVLSFQGG